MECFCHLAGNQSTNLLVQAFVWPITLESFKVKIWIGRYLRITDMQLLILNANSIIWGVGKSFNWNHIKKHFDFFFLYCKENGTGGKITNKRQNTYKEEGC